MAVLEAQQQAALGEGAEGQPLVEVASQEVLQVGVASTAWAEATHSLEAVGSRGADGRTVVDRADSPGVDGQSLGVGNLGARRRKLVVGQLQALLASHSALCWRGHRPCAAWSAPGLPCAVGMSPAAALALPTKLEGPLAEAHTHHLVGVHSEDVGGVHEDHPDGAPCVGLEDVEEASHQDGARVQAVVQGVTVAAVFQASLTQGVQVAGGRSLVERLEVHGCLVAALWVGAPKAHHWGGHAAQEERRLRSSPAAHLTVAHACSHVVVAAFHAAEAAHAAGAAHAAEPRVVAGGRRAVGLLVAGRASQHRAAAGGHEEAGGLELVVAHEPRLCQVAVAAFRAEAAHAEEPLV